MASPTTSSTLSLFAITALLVLLSLLSPNAIASDTHDKTTSSFGFLEHLKGCKKGDKVQGIQDLKKYLERFGYLNGHSDNDDFDDLVESAIKTYQLNYNLKVTGTLDQETVSHMAMPRCGVPDIINGTTSMRSGNLKTRHSRHKGSVHTVGHFALFPGKPKWPPKKYHLTYAFNEGTRSDAFAPVSRAFATWAGNSQFTFTQVQRNQNPDLTIGFARGDHGDGFPFDGRGKILAHAFSPTNGRFHFDADEPWAVGAVEGAYDMETIALHEIGHLLGLGHSSVPGAIMVPQVSAGYTQSLHGDDVQGIRALYNT